MKRILSNKTEVRDELITYMLIMHAVNFLELMVYRYENVSIF